METCEILHSQTSNGQSNYGKKLKISEQAHTIQSKGPGFFFWIRMCFVPLLHDA